VSVNAGRRARDGIRHQAMMRPSIGASEGSREIAISDVWVRALPSGNGARDLDRAPPPSMSSMRGRGCRCHFSAGQSCPYGSSHGWRCRFKSRNCRSRCQLKALGAARARA
jgi:hypothetical protein